MEKGRGREKMEWVSNSSRINCNGIVEAAEEEENTKAGGLGRAEGVGTGGGTVEGMLYVKVMTDEQMEVLRKQISVYATICEELVEMHKAITAQQDSIAGTRLGNMYCDPTMTSGGHKITARQRWTPTPVQLQILESIFDQGNGTPSKQKIKEIASELSQHGQISETNVYNWFQNRRARSKRKQGGTPANYTESEIEVEVESPKERRAKLESGSHENKPPREDDFFFQSPEITSEVRSVDPDIHKVPVAFPPTDSSKSSGTLGQMFFYDNVESHSRIQMGIPGNHDPFHMGEGYDMIG